MQRCIFVLAAVWLSIAGCGEGITEPIVPNAVRLSAVADTLAWGETTTLTASYVVGGATRPSDGGLRWSSSEPQYFSIDSLTGRGEAFEAGLGAHPVIVIAESHGVADTMTVIIVPTIRKLFMTLSSAVATGRTFRPAIQALDGVAHREFTPPPESGPLVLRSSNPAVVSVETDGRLMARSAGLAWVTATLLGASDSTQVRVGSGYGISLIPLSIGFAPFDINDVGQVIVSGDRGASARYGSLFNGDTRVSLPCKPRAINNAGTIACFDGRIVAGGSIGAYPNGNAFSATDIMESGAVFAIRHLPSPPDAIVREAVLWDGITVTPLAGSRCCGPLQSIGHVNGLGHWTGVVDAPDPDARLVLFRGSAGLGLTLPGSLGGINDAGDVVGSAGSRPAGSGEAVVWLAAEQWKGRRLGLRTSWSAGISEDGLVVGEAMDGTFVWRGGRYALLNDLVAEDGWTIRWAPRISRGGMIVAEGSHTSGKAGLVRITATGAP